MAVVTGGILVDMLLTLAAIRRTLVTITVNTMEVTLPITVTSSIFTVSITSFIAGSEGDHTA